MEQKFPLAGTNVPIANEVTIEPEIGNHQEYCMGCCFERVPHSENYQKNRG